MELQKCNNDFPIDNEKRKNKNGAIKDEFNDSAFTKILNETIKEEGKIKTSREDTSCKLKVKE